MNPNGVEYYYIRNVQSDIIGLFDKSGAQVVSYSYDSWGKPAVTVAEQDDKNDTAKDGITGSLASTVGVENPYRYKGYRYDTETGLYYLQSRYYNAEWGRMLNADSVGGQVGDLLSHNAFAYCKNNPINMSDSSGHWPTWAQIKKYIAPAIEFAAGALMVGAGVIACATGNVILGVGLIAYGVNHMVSAGSDIYNISKGNDEEVGKNNWIRNRMKEGFGEEAGNTIYEVCDLAVSVCSFKVPTPQKLTKVPSVTIQNVNFGIVKNNITTYTGTNGVRNIFSRGYNVRYDKVAIAGNSVRGYAGKFINIFDGGEE